LLRWARGHPEGKTNAVRCEDLRWGGGNELDSRLSIHGCSLL
jgi:hypothetical protein